MLESNSSTPAPSKPTKPAKPYPEFPLTAHPAGYWCKKIRGKMHYFGRWDDPDGALAKYLEQKDDLHAGRITQADQDALTVITLVRHFLTAKLRRVEAGERSPRTLANNEATMALVIKAFGKERRVADLGPADFAKLRGRITKKLGLLGRGNAIRQVRSLFKYALEAGLIDRPAQFGPDFRPPEKKAVTLYRAKQGPKLFTAEEVRQLLGAASVPMKAMLLLAVNCGFGNNDCARLPQSALNLDTGTVDFPRPKTGRPRRAMLWAETAEALRQALASRPEPKDPADAGLVFLTHCGQAWAKDTPDNPVSKEFVKLLRRLGINGRKGLGFYTLRHTFRTVADEARDQPAADYIMGHESGHMSGVYRERISDERLQAVADHVRAWLFAVAEQTTLKIAKVEEEEPKAVAQ